MYRPLPNIVKKKERNLIEYTFTSGNRAKLLRWRKLIANEKLKLHNDRDQNEPYHVIQRMQLKFQEIYMSLNVLNKKKDELEVLVKFYVNKTSRVTR